MFKDKEGAYEKQTYHELEKNRKKRKADLNQPNDESDQDSNDFASMSAADRIKAARQNSASKPDKENKIPEGADLTKKEYEAYIESPMPKTLAIDMIPIEKIVNGTIYAEDGHRCKILEILPINFLLKDDNDQENIVGEFEKFLQVMPDEMQIKSFSQKTDLSSFIIQADNYIRTENDARCRRMIGDNKNLLMEIGSSESITRRFFIVIPQKKKNGLMLSDEESEKELMSDYRRAEAYIRQCGNLVKDIRPDETTNETAKILFDILNREKNSSVDFSERIDDVLDFYETKYGKSSLDMIPIKEYFTPERINMNNSDYIKLDDTYYTYMYITSDGYPSEVPKGWLSVLVNAGDGIDVDIFFKRENKEQMSTRIGRRLRWQNARISSVSNTTDQYSDLSSSITSGYYLKQGLSANRNDLYYMSVIITVSAGDLKSLRQKKDAMDTYLKTMEIYVGNCNYEMDRAFTSTLPLCSLDRKIYQRAKINVLTQDLAAWYPFTSFEICDNDGILLGVNEMNNSFSAVDFFNTDNYKNANIAILGTSGAGKSYLLQLMALRFREKQIQTFVILPEKGHEFVRANRCVGGEFISLAPGSPQNINVMEIRKRDRSANAVLDGTEEQSELADKIQFLNTFVKLRLSDMTIVEEQLLDDALLRTYGKCGITHDNGSLIDPEDPERYRAMPVIGDLYNELLKVPEASRIATSIKIFVDGSCASFNQQTNVETDNLYTVIALDKMPEDMVAAGMLIAVDFVYGRAKENRTKRKVIILDELWTLIGAKSNARAAEYCLEIFKVIRGYGGSAICATQDLNDFFALEDGRFGKGIINACKTKIVLNLEKNEADSVRMMLGLSENEYKQILNFEKGHGLLSANGNNVPIHFKSSELENALITTDREELEKLVTDPQYAAFRELIAS